jgi:fatty-acyl-CoA synthase
VDRISPPDVGVGAWIERRARIAPDDIAVISGSRQVTYRELAGRIRRLANGLRGLGVIRGDRIAWLGPNHQAFLETLFAAGSLGCVLVPVNHRLGPEAILDILEEAGPTILIEHHSVGRLQSPTTVRQTLCVDGPMEGTRSYHELVGEAPDDRVDVRVTLEDLLLLPHTSGTAGRPKGVMLTHGNVTWNVLNLLSVADIRHADVTLAIAPFFRVGGTGVNVLPVLFMGGTVILPETTDPDTIITLIEQHRVTVGFGNPDLLEALTSAQRWLAADLSSIRFVITGGAPVPERLIHAYLHRGITLLQGYGLSEAAPVALLLDPQRALTKMGSAGRPPLFVDVRIVDDDGGDSAVGEVGELWIRGPNVMAGYWQRPTDTREALAEDGWLRTGDAARQDQEGFVWIVDRLRERFASAGRIVYPGDIERALMGHPGVADAAVVGMPGPNGDATVNAFVVPTSGGDATPDELIAYARSRLARHEVPAALEFVDRLPRNSVGKLQRELLRHRRA